MEILVKPRDAQADLNYRWAHKIDGTFSDVAALMVMSSFEYCLNLTHLNHTLSL